MERDGLSLAVVIRREEYETGFFCSLLQVLEELGLAANREVLGLEVSFDVYSDSRLRQVDEVSHRRKHRILRTEVLLDGLGLCRGLDYDEDAFGCGLLCAGFRLALGPGLRWRLCLRLGFQFRFRFGGNGRRSRRIRGRRNRNSPIPGECIERRGP